MSSSVEAEGTKMTPKGRIINGYKATDENICCKGFQFKIGKWYEHDGEIELCKSGFHFCTYPSGPWTYYTSGRLFKCEAELVILSTGPGADLKHVAKRIRLTKEITSNKHNSGYINSGDGNSGNWNTGDRNTGNGNAGNWNTGDRNTGDENTGDRNAGYRNAGNWNTGDRNTGDGNTGDVNTGNWNAGNWNAGNWNTGNRNTGDRNAGNWNTGYGNTGTGNCGDWHSGDFNVGDAPYYIFGKKADRKKVNHSLIRELCELLAQDDDFDPNPFLSLPNATAKKIKTLHEAHKAARRNI